MALAINLILTLNILWPLDNATAATIKRKYDLNNDRKTDFILILDPNFNIQFVDTKLNGVWDSYVFENINNRMEYSFTKKSLRLVHYRNDHKYELVYRPLGSDQYRLISARKFKLFQQFFALNNCDSEISVLNQTSNGKILYKKSVEINLERLKINNCSKDFESAIRMQFKGILSEETEIKNQVNLKSCIERLANTKLGQNPNIYHELITKWESIRNGTSDLKLRCELINSEKCRNFKAASFAYPDEIFFCISNDQLKNNAIDVTDTIIKHEILHSKGIELSEQQITSINKCLGRRFSPMDSDVVAEKKLEEASSEIAAGEEFNPGLEYQQIRGPSMPSQALFRNEIGDGYNGGYATAQIGNDSPVYRQGVSTSQYLDAFFKKMVPRAEASILTQNKNRSDFGSPTSDIDNSGVKENFKSSKMSAGEGANLSGNRNSMLTERPEVTSKSVDPKTKLVQSSGGAVSVAANSRGEGSDLTRHENPNMNGKGNESKRILNSVASTDRSTEDKELKSKGLSLNENESNKKRSSTSGIGKIILDKTSRPLEKKAKRQVSGQELNSDPAKDENEKLTVFVNKINNKSAREVKQLLEVEKYRRSLVAFGIVIYFKSGSRVGASSANRRFVFTEDQYGVIKFAEGNLGASKVK
jgi:hypothetical protein